ncbi:MAG TPA: ATP-dependent DNA helicase RecG [Candidatus Methylomirabilis sp.]|nr:ATP-dependent DNA helicase RecG [Candidatus Methylomirabilis sp.]
MRDPAALMLETPVEALKGIGPSRAERLARLGVRTLREALLLVPRRYEDRRVLLPIGRLRLGAFQSVAGQVKAVGIGRTRRGVSYCEVRLEDGTGTLLARWYRQPYLARTFRRGQRAILAGRVSPYPPREMINPEHEIHDGSDASYHTGRIVPIYPLTAGLSQRFLRRWLADLARARTAEVADPLPPSLWERRKLCSLPEAVRGLHLPGAMEEAAASRRRLAFDEFFLFSLAVLRQRAARAALPGIAFRVPGTLVARARSRLPFGLTAAQERALQSIWDDMAQSRPMQRLLQGEVGSGKTIVAILAALTAIDSGYQAAFMAPTEILAAQHADRARALLTPLGVPVVHVAGGLGAPARREALALLAGTSACLAIGTHALLQPDVVFGRLGFAVVDEQHRFGVLQRAGLREKGAQPDVLVMTATPIPRSLALVLYGDLDLSVIDELPPGRVPVTTTWMGEGDRRRVEAELAARLDRGERAYIVCPAVEESAAELTAALQTSEAYRRGPLARFGVGLVHGRLRPAEKLRAVADFRDGRVRLLVATTVVEVGMDVPEATAMVIEQADRLGLAQLHQLRGRVGRSERAAVCFVLADRREITEEARARLEAFVREGDGFALAEADLRLRGPGEFFGTRQAGLDGLPLGDLASDLRLLQEARADAAAILEVSPALDGEWMAVRAAMEGRWAARLALGQVG